MSNFSFLKVYWPSLAKIMDFAESYVYTDPASSKNKSGLFVELMVREILRIENIDEPETDNTHFIRTRLLKNEGLLPYDVNKWINQVRKSRNEEYIFLNKRCANHSSYLSDFSQVICKNPSTVDIHSKLCAR